MAVEELQEAKQKTDMATLAADVSALVTEWSSQRSERQLRRSLDPADFERLKAIGFHLIPVPVEFGGLWRTASESTRGACEILRTLAHADSSIALVCSMHPSVLVASADSRDFAAHEPGWEEQRRWKFQTVLNGALWGPIVSEPGSGGDVKKTKAEARKMPDGRYLLSGLKHFGSGSGIMSFQDTTAIPEGGGERVSLILDMRGVPWDGSAGVKLVAEWDGHGMTATQSHAFEFSDFPAVASLRRGLPATGFPSMAWSAIVLGIVEEALSEARGRLDARVGGLRPYERIEWANAELGLFLIRAAYEAVLCANESDAPDISHIALQGKTAIAQLAESTMAQICRVIGGTSFSRSTPFGYWLEDVRALGLLRPPWGLAFDSLFDQSWPASAPV